MQIKYTLLIFCVFCSIVGSGQTEKVLVPDAHAPSSNVYTYVEKMPRAGYNFQEYISKNIHYTDSAVEYRIQGSVFVKFVVNEDGSISDCIVKRGIGWGLDEEALRVVKSFPRWEPGTQNGKAVKVYFMLPIEFKLRNNDVKKDTIGQLPPSGVYTYVDKMPAVGYDYQEYLSKTIVYPYNARKKNIEGRVIVRFIVNEDGSISDCKVVKSAEPSLDAEALRVVSSFPRWKPGKVNGKAVKVYFNLPIVFKLTD